MENQKISTLKYILLGILLIIISVVSVFIMLPSILGLFPWWDIDKINDSDLSLKKIEIPQDKNAFYDLDKISGVIYCPDDMELLTDAISGETWDQEFINNLLIKNEEALGYLKDAAQKESFQDPYTDSPEDMVFYNPLASIGAWRNIAKLSKIKAMALSREGKTEEAIDEAFNSVVIGQKIEDSQPSTIEYLVGSAMKRIGLDALTQIISSPDISSNQLKGVILRLEGSRNDREGLKRVIKSEYQIQKSIIEALVNKNDKTANEYLKHTNPDLFNKTDNHYYFQANKTLKLFADQTRIEVENASKTYSQVAPAKKEKGLPYYWHEKYLFENIYGEWFYQTKSIEWTALIRVKCEEELYTSATTLLAALEAYKLEYGMLPNSLDELTAGYISFVPIDPFDGNQIRYSVQKKILYSVGEDLVDEGGSIGDAWNEMPDPTFQIPF